MLGKRAAAAMLLGAVGVVAVALILAGVFGGGGPSTMRERVDAVASDLRCPVCQNLSVADSPSLVAREMRVTIARQLGAGATPDEVKSYFVRRYGRWILLSPDTSGLGLVVWVAPALALLAGALLVLGRVRGRPSSPAGSVTATEHDRIERELAAFEEPE